GADRSVPDAEVLGARNHAARARLDRALRRVRQASRRPRRLGARRARPGARGDGRLARRARRPRRHVPRDREEAESVRKALDWLIASIVLLLGRRRRKPPEVEQRIVPPAPPDRRAETVLLLLFGASTICAAGFIAVVALDRIGNQTPYLGLSLGLSLAFLAAALVMIAKRLVVTEEIDEPYTPPEHPVEQAELDELVEESGERFTRKRLVTMAGAGAVGTLGLAVVAPLVSLGPVFDLESFAETPWRRGRRLVGEDGRPLHAGEIEEGTFYTAYAAHAD